MFTLADFADGQARVRRYDGALPKGEVPGAQIAVRRVGTETRYEAAIPWKEINPAFRPTEGQTISLAFTIDDNDEGTSGRRGMSWFSLATTKNPAAFGDVTLVRPGAAPAAAPPANLLPNGNFESDTLPPGPQMQGWTLSAGSAGEQNAEASLTTAGAYQGRSLKIHRLSPKNNMEVGGWRVPVHGGEVYLFRCLARSDERQVIAWLRPLDAAGKSLPSLGDTQALSPAASWHYGCGLYLNAAEAPDRSQYSPLVGVFETPAGAAQVQVSFSYSWATGDAYVDNAELYRLR
jgi:hypothetical protein